MATATQPQTTSLQLRRTFAAPPEKVFRAWTDPAALKQWFGPPHYKTIDVQIDLRKGGKYRITLQEPDGDPKTAFGTYHEGRPPERLVYSCNWDYNPVGETIVTLEFMDVGGQTELVLTHERFPTIAARDSHNQGWAGCFYRLDPFLRA